MSSASYFLLLILAIVCLVESAPTGSCPMRDRDVNKKNCNLIKGSWMREYTKCRVHCASTRNCVAWVFHSGWCQIYEPASKGGKCPFVKAKGRLAGTSKC